MVVATLCRLIAFGCYLSHGLFCSTRHRNTDQASTRGAPVQWIKRTSQMEHLSPHGNETNSQVQTLQRRDRGRHQAPLHAAGTPSNVRQRDALNSMGTQRARPALRRTRTCSFTRNSRLIHYLNMGHSFFTEANLHAQSWRTLKLQLVHRLSEPTIL